MTTFTRIGICVSLLISSLTSTRAAAEQTAGSATIRGTVTTSAGTSVLPGVTVAAEDVAGAQRQVQTVTDGSGTFVLSFQGAGSYNVTAQLSGFAPARRNGVVVAPGSDVRVDFDLLPGGRAEDVTVTAEGAVANVDTAVPADSIRGRLIDYLPVAGDSYRALLPVLPGVVRAPDGRMTLKGARESQGSLQVGRAYANDPSTGNFGVELPADSVETVDVLGNPYAAEDGRFSSTVVRVETRPGGDTWRAVANGFVPIPCLTLCDGSSLGVRSYRPRGWIGGPLVKNRLFLAQGLQYRFAKVRVPSLPDGQNDTSDRGLEAFTRLDAKVSDSHTITATLAVFPRRAHFVNLSTFVPAEASPSYRLNGSSVAIAAQSVVSKASVLESGLTTTWYDSRVGPEAESQAELTVNGARGGYFETQTRRTRSLQWSESLMTAVNSAAGSHVVRIGLDVLVASYDGTSEARPVTIRRADGTASQRFTFGDATRQHVRGMDIGMFVQDRWRIHERLLIEPGLRLDRDGVARDTGVSPRLGVVVGVLGQDTGVVRGGIGVFRERTPLNVGAFTTFGAPTLERFAADGVRRLGAPVTYTLSADALATPRSRVWNLEYDHRIGRHVFLKANHTERTSSRAAIVRPLEATHEWRLSSDGSGRYEETELSIRAGASDMRQVGAAYVRSSARGDLNVFDTYFGNLRQPIVRANAYGLLPTDVPNRLLVRAINTWRDVWTLSGVVEVRDGFPFSAVNQDQEFVGVRNGAGRFPRLFTVDLSLIKAATIRGRAVRFGVRAYHVLNQAMPRDVQTNIDSPAYGTFYNPLPRRLSVTFTFLPK